jgi:hypothetical protein
MQSSPASRHFPPLMSKYSPQRPVLRHLQSMPNSRFSWRRNRCGLLGFCAVEFRGFKATFRRPCCLQLQGWISRPRRSGTSLGRQQCSGWTSSIAKFNPEDGESMAYETLVSNHETMGCNNLENHDCYPQSMFIPWCKRPSFTPTQNNRQNYSFVYFNLYDFREETGRHFLNWIVASISRI